MSTDSSVVKVEPHNATAAGGGTGDIDQKSDNTSI